ncbi:precorrin-2 dehydrogenase/sirohydrochlorin ferrochelatase family protein [Dictyobacter arantiisoli]|uniref:precorrin-2 dehydrogenase n=1 Tax=Dictyobacter arantiisoli TaxID=2014874 RepID=A0A5A5TG15_9CHLR|nr:bifunctional precorrin-2 dehydrogenase/sirohydrochlorin ferrochelatase [Dictyobacter arantiisoli]GCF10521.1 precorrin-2 oxidase [Dictyobacter arantiisoli]
MPNYYPIMLDVRQRPALVIGGNMVAAEKAAALHAAGAQVTVQNGDFCEVLHDMERTGTVTLRYKAYEASDLVGFFVIVATATYEPELAEAIWQDGQRNNQLVNIVDYPSRCNFIIPSILRRGPLTVSVSTEGTSPGLAKRIRQRLEDFFPATYESYMRLATIARRYLRANGQSYDERDQFFGEFFTSDILNLLSEHDDIEALASTIRLLRRYNVDISMSTIIQDMQEPESELL